jgi:exopolyphosphatase/guanosine-5'-triphosphate,3'-diphosphate pyrophosphatase
MPARPSTRIASSRRRRAHASPPAAGPPVLAVIDMGSNSFRLEIARVEDGHIFRLDTIRETLRMGASMDVDGNMRAPYVRAALACLARFGERVRGLHASAVRAVATNTFRVARNAPAFLARAEKLLGFPIEVVSGHEEARLIYLGVAHVLPRSHAPRLVVDIGGGSTEVIIGRDYDALALESLDMGCVSWSQRHFGDGRLTAQAFAAAITQASAEVEAIARDFDRHRWREAYASSGTALALADILEQNGLSAGGITPDGLAALRARLVRARSIDRVQLAGLKPARAPVLAGGLAIMEATLAGLRVPRINPVGGALRLGVMVDMLGRRASRDAREATVAQLAERYRVDMTHGRRVAATARALLACADAAPSPDSLRRIGWGGLLHEIGYGVSHQGFHKHGAYILQHADMPGFDAREQRLLALLVLGCRGNLAKVAPLLADPERRAEIFALRLAVLLHHARRAVVLPPLAMRADAAVGWRLPARWLAGHPLTSHLLDEERARWIGEGYRVVAPRARRAR